MRKQLMAGTALAAAAMFVAGGALAADKKMMKPSMSVGGYHNVIVGGFVDENADPTSPSDTSGLDVRTNAEVWVGGKAALDNGVKISTRIEVEGQSHHATADPIDEYFLSLSGTFGQIILGGTSGVPAKMVGGYSGRGVGVGAHLHFDNWVANAGKANTYTAVGDVDSEKISYISPSFGGFQVGLSYSPEISEATGNNRVNADMEGHDGLGGAVRYSGKFGDVGVGIGASMRTVQGANDTPDSDQSRWSIGGYIDFGGGFRVAAAHARNDDDNEAANGQATDLGVRFVQGANQFSVMGVLAELDDSPDTRTTVIGSYARGLGAGVAAHADVVWSESEGTTASGDKQTADGLVMLTGIKVRF